MRSQRFASLVMGLTLLACASPPPGGGATTPKPSSDLITAAELATVPQSDLYAAIQQLRSGFFRTRGITAPGAGSAPEEMQVYVNGTKKGNLDALHQIQAIDVREVRRLSATEATQRYGTGHTMGAIVVTLR
jgi:hypothetical protein